MRTIKSIWQFPQILLAKLLIKMLGLSFMIDYKGAKIYSKKGVNFGVSLGPYILIGTEWYHPRLIAHEYGHSIQSLILGPLYLILVGIPSVSMNILSRIIKGKYAENYYNRWPENWADKLGGVSRT